MCVWNFCIIMYLRLQTNILKANGTSQKKNSNFKTRKEQLLMFWVNQCKSKLVIVTTLQDVLIVNLSIQSWNQKHVLSKHRNQSRPSMFIMIHFWSTFYKIKYWNLFTNWNKSIFSFRTITFPNPTDCTEIRSHKMYLQKWNPASLMLATFICLTLLMFVLFEVILIVVFL